MALASDYSVVAVVELSPCLLQYKDPQLIAISARKNESFISCREMIINNNADRIAIFCHFYSVDTLGGELVRDEEPSNSITSFSGTGEHTKEVTVSEAALANIVGLDGVRENGKLAIIIV